MKRRVFRHPEALADVKDSATYIGLDSPSSAMRFIDAVETTLNVLIETPEVGSSRSFGRGELRGLRAFPVRGFERHLVFYRPTEYGIEVFRILHGARDLGAAFDPQEHR